MSENVSNVTTLPKRPSTRKKLVVGAVLTLVVAGAAAAIKDRVTGGSAVDTSDV